jgi:hypothetical protein
MTTLYRVYNGASWDTLSNLSVYNGSWQSLRMAKKWDGSNWNTFWDSFQLNWLGESELVSPNVYIPPSGGGGFGYSAVKTISGLSSGETITLEGSIRDITREWQGIVNAYKRTPPAAFSLVGEYQFDNDSSSFTVTNGDELYFVHQNGDPNSEVQIFYGTLFLYNISYSPATLIHSWSLEGLSTGSRR